MDEKDYYFYLLNCTQFWVAFFKTNHDFYCYSRAKKNLRKLKKHRIRFYISGLS